MPRATPIVNSMDRAGQEPTEPIVNVPALGLGTVALLIATSGLFFLGLGLLFDAVIAERPPPDAFIYWFLRAFCWTFILAGGFLILWAAAETLRRFELSVNEGQLRRTTIVGPIRWRRQWGLNGIAGTTLRQTGVVLTGGEPWSRLQLIFNDGNCCDLLPQRLASILRPANDKLRQLLSTEVSKVVDESPPLGGGLSVSEASERTTIHAGSDKTVDVYQIFIQPRRRAYVLSSWERHFLHLLLSKLAVAGWNSTWQRSANSLS